MAKLTLKNKFQGSGSSIELRPLIPALKEQKIKSAKLAQKKGSELCFLLFKDDKETYSLPCGPSVDISTPLDNLFLNEDNVVCTDGETTKFETL